MEINLGSIRQAEGLLEEITPLKNKLEERINLSQVVGNEKRLSLTMNKVLRICLIAGLSISEKRREDYKDIKLSTNRLFETIFSYNNMRQTWIALLKMRYRDCAVDWSEFSTVSRVIAAEINRGCKYLMDDNNLNAFLFSTSVGKNASNSIPALNLLIGNYGDEDMEATLNINDSNISNTQILIAGSTGSGKTNLLAVLINQFRTLSTETPYPVNFLLFDYKGEFSDPANNDWLTRFDVDRTCILDPVQKPLPFTPFKNFVGRSINEINLYSTEMANALCAIERTNISANMNNRLSEAIVDCYKKTQGAPITFELMLSAYQARMEKPDKDDSITSTLKQLVRNNLFETEDKVNLVNECFIVKMDSFPKDGPIAKAIVYFIVSKLNIIYEQLEQQAKSDDLVEIRHFTIIDEAHYMLDFDNRPLRNLIAVGRNKGLSIILATQNMESFKSKHFDF